MNDCLKDLTKNHLCDLVLSNFLRIAVSTSFSSNRFGSGEPRNSLFPFSLRRRALDSEAKWLDVGLIGGMMGNLKSSKSPTRELDAEASLIASLSPREREVSIAVAKGLTNEQVGTELLIRPRTVRHHLTSTFGKLGISNRFELIVLCYRHKLTKPRRNSPRD